MISNYNGSTKFKWLFLAFLAITLCFTVNLIDVILTDKYWIFFATKAFVIIIAFFAIITDIEEHAISYLLRRLIFYFILVVYSFVLLIYGKYVEDNIIFAIYCEQYKSIVNKENDKNKLITLFSRNDSLSAFTSTHIHEILFDPNDKISTDRRYSQRDERSGLSCPYTARRIKTHYYVVDEICD